MPPRLPVPFRTARAGRIRRRLGAAWLAVVIASTAALAGCTSPDEASEEQQVELSVFWWGGERRAELTEQALRVYSKRHPHVTFKFTWQGNTGYYERLATAAASGNPPDLFQMDDNYLSEYVQRDIVLDLTEYVRTEQIDLRRLPSSLVQYGQIGGRTVAIAAAENTPGLIYNKSLLDRLGLPAPTVGMSYDAYLRWAEEVTRRTGGKVAGTMDPSADYKALWLWLRSQGKELYRGRQVGFTENDLTRWFSLWRRARDSGAAPPFEVIQEANGGDFDRQLIVTGKAAASFMWSNQLPELQKLTDDKLDVVAYPGKPEAHWARASLYWAGFRGTRHPEVVADVINFLINDLEAGQILGTERGLCANLDVRTVVQASLTDESMKLSADYETKMADRFGVAPAPPPQGHSTVRSLLRQAAESVQAGRATPRQAASTLIVQANAALNS